VPVPNPFLESPADFDTRAPNFSKLGQAGRARQELVSIGKRTHHMWG
jgi:hypothetical protein